MLVLTRKRGQTIRIGDTTVHFLGVLGRVRLGIDAPDDVTVLRGEAKPRDKKPSSDGVQVTVTDETAKAA